MKRLSFFSATLLALASLSGGALVACGGGTEHASDAGVDQAPVQQDATARDSSTPNDTSPPPPVDAGQTDLGVQTDGNGGAWPPAGPFHSGKTCTLPACDTGGAATVDLTGTWSQQLTTTSCDCNALAISMKPELQNGHVMTKTGLASPRQGECVYDSTNTSLIVGVIKGNVMVTCQVMPAEQGVTPVVESVMTFGSGSATGTATTYLFDVPVPPAQCQATYAATMTKE
jgi:hypothetical protein